MSVRWRARCGAFVLVAVASAACNLITGAQDRVLDERDAFPDVARDTGSDAKDEPIEPIPDASPPEDAGPDVITVDVSKTFASPNGAMISTSAQGTRISGYTTFTHPVIFPAPQPSVPSQDYTLTATILVGEASEFGILTRGQANGSSVVFGSMYGAVQKPFLGSMSNTDWGPTLNAQGPTYTFKPSIRYRLSAKVQGTQVWGKMWESTQPAPDWQVVAIAPWATGTGIGFYVYNTTTPVVESMIITVP
jgi:hypothetical protein